MFERFFPDEYVVSTYVIPFERLYEEGYRGVIFDIDNTLVPHVFKLHQSCNQFFADLQYRFSIRANHNICRIFILLFSGAE